MVLLDCPGEAALPTAIQCETAGECACAQQIDCFVRAADPESNWPLLPTGALHWNPFFWHTRFLEIRISPAGESAYRGNLDPAVAMSPLPPGTIVYKEGFAPEEGDPAVPDLSNHDAFVATKLEGHYCPQSSEVGDACQGGGWFWYHVDSPTPDSDEMNADMFTGYGKPSKCVACHDTAARTDFLISLTVLRRYPPAGSTPR